VPVISSLPGLRSVSHARSLINISYGGHLYSFTHANRLKITRALGGFGAREIPPLCSSGVRNQGWRFD